MDSGYDETQNPFADVSEEYTKKKEESMAKKAVKRMSAQQRQINKVLWEFTAYTIILSTWLVHLSACYLGILGVYSLNPQGIASKHCKMIHNGQLIELHM